VLEQKVQDNITYKLVVNNTLNKPSWILFITGIVECSFNFGLYHVDINVFLGFEGLDSMSKLFLHILSRKPERMLC
jgi:hypothetical protein